MPGTTFAGENAACSTSAKTFSGLRFSSKNPTSMSAGTCDESKALGS